MQNLPLAAAHFLQSQGWLQRVPVPDSSDVPNVPRFSTTLVGVAWDTLQGPARRPTKGTQGDTGPGHIWDIRDNPQWGFRDIFK